MNGPGVTKRTGGDAGGERTEAGGGRARVSECATGNYIFYCFISGAGGVFIAGGGGDGGGEDGEGGGGERGRKGGGG